MDDWKKKKMAVYIRRSQGEKGGVKEQLARILPMISKLEKEGKIKKVNRGILGRDIEGKKRFNPREAFKGVGDIYNEGNRQSAFGKPASRPVLMELLDRLKQDEYDGILFESIDRFSRDPPEMHAVALDLWREDGKFFADMSNPTMGYYPDDPLREALTNAILTFGGLSKKEEIKKAKRALIGDTVDMGYFKGGFPQWAGSKQRFNGIDYRKAWKLMEALGENDKGNLISAGVVDKEFKRPKNWSRTWYRKMKGWNELGVLEEWLDNYEAVNQYIINIGPQPGKNYKKDPIVNLLKSTAGYFAYPGGVNPAKSEEFIKFPSPLDVGIELLAEDIDPKKYDPRGLPKFDVQRLSSEGMELHPAQTQPRSTKKK